MRQSTNLKFSELKVGLLVIVSVIILTAAIVSFGHLADLFQPKRLLSAVFHDVRGLRTGAPVWLGGVEAGHVRRISFPVQDERFGIAVDMLVDAGMAALIRADSTASIRTQGLLGDIYVEIALGSPSALPLPPDQPLEGIVPVDLKELVSGSSITLSEFGRALRNLNSLIVEVSKADGSFGRFVHDPSLYEELSKLSKESRELIRHLDQGEGSAGRLLRDPELYDRMTAAAERLASMAESFEQLGEEMRRGEGTVGKLTRDSAVYDSLASATGSLDRVMASVEAGEGLVGQLVADEELAREVKLAVAEFRSASAEFRGLMEDMKEHPKKYFRFELF